MAISDFTTSVSAVAAAAAATASWVSVRAGNRDRQAAMRPELVGQVLHRSDEGVMHLVIHNGGGGLAKQTAYVLVSRETRDWAYGYVLPHGFVRRDETVRIFAAMEPYGIETLGVLACRDMAENTWGWNMQGDKVLLSSARRHRKVAQPLDQTDMVRAFYPDIDPTELERRDSCVIQDRPVAGGQPKGEAGAGAKGP